MNTLIVKVGATGDVVRTTPLLSRLKGQVTWLTASKNTVLLEGLNCDLRCFSWEERERALDTHYDLCINLEDTLDVAQFLENGAGAARSSALMSIPTAHYVTRQIPERWFDLSLISSYGKMRADKLKFQNRQTYQELIFEGLGFRFAGETYLLPEPIETGLSGDVAIAADAGPIWPMKKWAYYDELKQRLEEPGLIVNVLPQRASSLSNICPMSETTAVWLGVTVCQCISRSERVRDASLSSPVLARGKFTTMGCRKRLFLHFSRNSSTNADMINARQRQSQWMKWKSP